MRTSELRTCIRGGLITVMVMLGALASAPAFGQGQQGAIIGQVKDQSGAILPGVTVTVTSPALQVPQITAVTNEVGEYRVAPLSLGVYAVTFELPSFQTIRREGVQLTVGFTAKIDVAMSLGSLAETVQVSGQSPVVDVKSTSGVTVLTNAVLEATPTTRNGVMSLLTLAPGVRTFLDVGGNQIAENSQTRAFGQGGATWFTLDGVAVIEPNRTFWDYQTLEEARVQTVGTDAEFPTRGVQVNAIVKSGGNQFHGSGNWAWEGEKSRSDNVDKALLDLGIEKGNAIVKQYDVGGDLGGRLVRDKLWFYAAARKRHQELQVLNAFKPDGSPANTIVESGIYTQKYSFQANPSNRFVFLNVLEHTFEDTNASELRSYEARESKTNKHPINKIEWEGTRGNSLMANLQFGHVKHDTPVGFLAGGQVGREDLATEKVTGENVVSGEHALRWVYHTRGTLTWYKPNWFHGNHEFKTGFDYTASTDSRSMEVKPVNYHLLYDDGAPFEVVFFNAPVDPGEVANVLGSFVKDSWTIGRRLTLNYGLRFAHEAAFVPEVCREAAKPPSEIMFPATCFSRQELPTWNTVAPRVHMAFDLTGDGRTLLKGGWARYDHMRRAGDGIRNDRNSVAYGIFLWRDLNKNNDWDPGETNRDPNGSDYVETTAMEFGSLPPNFVPNPDEKQVHYDEFSVSLERELMPNFSLRATGIRSNVWNVNRIMNVFRPYEAYNVPVTRPDPGPDGTVGNSDDGSPITYFEYSRALRGTQFEENMPVTDSKGNQHYTSFEVSAVKRLSNRWQLTVSYSATKKYNPICCAGLASTARLNTAAFRADNEVGFQNPNAEINTFDKTWDWDGKMTGAYNFPGDVQVSTNLHMISGESFARTVQLRGGATIPNIVVNAEPFGSRRLPRITLLDLRAEKIIRLAGTHRLSLRVNVYNSLNVNTATRMQPRSGPNFLRPLEIMPPRIADFGMVYTF